MKPEQINDALLLGQFADYIAARWQSDYQHGYPITRHHAWKAWRLRHDGLSAPWSCASLSEAAQHWCWTEAKGDASFPALAKALQQAISVGDELEAAQLCCQIYRWGGVARRFADASQVWVRAQVETNALTGALRDAVALLSPNSANDLHRFNRGDLLMTSATSKLYAAADPTGAVTIYDGRVGAALGLLARQFLESRHLSVLPQALHFMWGPAQVAAQAAAKSRDPSRGALIFRQLPHGDGSHHVRAELSRRTNLLFQAVIDRLAQQDIRASLLELERAFFMVGYCVR